MQWSDIQFDPPRRVLRQFAGLWLAFFGGLALHQGLVRDHPRAAWVLAALALGVGLLGLVRPPAVRPLYVGWMVLAFPIGWTVSRLILAAVYFGLFTPVALVFRLIGRDALSRTRRPDAATYWTPKPAPADPRSYFRQF
ncbi:MAG: hypothetical protein IRY99_27540 [Isosphaeraceae bacterium]|nr:hypothetical protein [Isosphaeraceae bacterium]